MIKVKDIRGRTPYAMPITQIKKQKQTAYLYCKGDSIKMLELGIKQKQEKIEGYILYKRN